MKAFALTLHHLPMPTVDLSVVARWIKVAAERRALSRLTDAQLADIGITRAQAEAESRRAFWDVPAHR